jgi:hypothetical protein
MLGGEIASSPRKSGLPDLRIHMPIPGKPEIGGSSQ